MKTAEMSIKTAADIDYTPQPRATQQQSVKIFVESEWLRVRDQGHAT